MFNHCKTNHFGTGSMTGFMNAADEIIGRPLALGLGGLAWWGKWHEVPGREA